MLWLVLFVASLNIDDQRRNISMKALATMDVLLLQLLLLCWYCSIVSSAVACIVLLLMVLMFCCCSFCSAAADSTVLLVRLLCCCRCTAVLEGALYTVERCERRLDTGQCWSRCRQRKEEFNWLVVACNRLGAYDWCGELKTVEQRRLREEETRERYNQREDKASREVFF